MSDESTQAEAVELAQARGAVYRLLSRCFYAPTPELLEDLDHGPSASLLQNVLSGLQVGTREEMLAAAENGMTAESGADVSLLTVLRDEYMRLFEGPGHMEVAPYESVHRKDVSDLERGLVMGAATLDAKRRYAQAGLGIAKDFTDLPDHIAVELEFMYYLCAKEAAAGGSQADGVFVTAQQEFLREHFLKWLPQFCDAVERAARVRFYRDLARVTSAYIASEAADLLEPSAGTRVN